MAASDNGLSNTTPTRSRRQFLRAMGGASVLGLTGCIRQAGEDTPAKSNGADVGTVTVGVLVPLSGPFSPLGKAQEQAARIAVQWSNESDKLDFETEAVYEDTRTDPSTGRQKAQKLVQEDQVDYLAGCVNSSVSLAVADYADQQGVVYTSGGAAMDITESECNPYTFRNETNTAQQAAGLVNYAAKELGSKWWIHTADYAYGNSAINEIEQRIDAEEHGVEIVGTTTPEQGTSDFGSYISQITNSDTEVLAIPLTGSDLINFMKQAHSSGLKDEIDIIGTALFSQTIRGALGEAAYGTYSSTLYNHKIKTGDNQQFVEAYRSKYDTPPGSFARVGYEAVRMPARAIQETGSANSDAIAETLSGLEMTTILGKAAFRECDHQSLNPVWTGKLHEPESGDLATVELVNEVAPDDATPPCSDIKCDM